MTGVHYRNHRDYLLDQCAELRTTVIVAPEMFRVSGFSVIIMGNYFRV